MRKVDPFSYLLTAPMLSKKKLPLATPSTQYHKKKRLECY